MAMEKNGECYDRKNPSFFTVAICLLNTFGAGFFGMNAMNKLSGELRIFNGCDNEIGGDSFSLP
jgi:hypothetical protein